MRAPPSMKMSFIRLIAYILNCFIKHAGLIRVVDLQVPFMGTPEVYRRELPGVGDFLQYSICQSQIFRLLGLTRLIVNTNRS